MSMLDFARCKRRYDILVNARKPRKQQGLSLAKSLILGLMLPLGCDSFRRFQALGGDGQGPRSGTKDRRQGFARFRIDKSACLN